MHFFHHSYPCSAPSDRTASAGSFLIQIPIGHTRRPPVRAGRVGNCFVDFILSNSPTHKLGYILARGIQFLSAARIYPIKALLNTHNSLPCLPLLAAFLSVILLHPKQCILRRNSAICVPLPIRHPSRLVPPHCHPSIL